LPSGNDIVYVSGTFNQWSERIPLHVVQGATTGGENGEGGTNAHWEVTLLLSPGLYALRFIVDGKWRIKFKFYLFIYLFIYLVLPYRLEVIILEMTLMPFL
jgi:hypothetical protein